jgi:hypothetical protein
MVGFTLLYFRARTDSLVQQATTGIISLNREISALGEAQSKEDAYGITINDLKIVASWMDIPQTKSSFNSDCSQLANSYEIGKTLLAEKV